MLDAAVAAAVLVAVAGDDDGDADDCVELARNPGWVRDSVVVADALRCTVFGPAPVEQMQVVAELLHVD